MSYHAYDCLQYVMMIICCTFENGYIWNVKWFFWLFTGSEFVEDAPLEVCAKLVFDSKRERRQKEEAEEQARKDAEFLESIKKNKQKQKDKNDERGTHE